MTTTRSPSISPPLTCRTTLLYLKSSPPPASMPLTAKSTLSLAPRRSLVLPGRRMVAKVVGAYNELTKRMMSPISKSSLRILFQGLKASILIFVVALRDELPDVGLRVEI
ncbi:hypothetical protein Droror1_Dr00027104 [Drosera rotundifolia]